MSENTIDSERNGRTLAVQPLLEIYYRKTGANDPVAAARDEILFRSLDLCDGDPNGLDANGLPLSKKRFKILENRLSRFLKLADSKLVSFDETCLNPEDCVEIRGQVQANLNRVGVARGALEEVFDENDEIIGPYVSQLEDVFSRAGTSSDNLVHGNYVLESGKYDEVLQACFSVARDMILIIGSEKYDEVRAKIDRSLFRRYSAEEIMSTASHSLAVNERRGNPNGFWNQLPRVWAEDLMILARNPEIVQRICEYKGSTKDKGVRDLITRFNKQTAQRKKEKGKMTQVEYFQANIKEEDFTDRNCAFEMLERRHNTYVPSIAYSPHYERDEIEEMRAFRRHFFEGFDEKRGLRAITNFCAVLSNYDESFRDAHPKAVLKKSVIVGKNTLNSARVGLKEWLKSFDRIKPIRQMDPPHTFVARAQFDEGRKKSVATLDVFSNNPPSVLCRNVGKADVVETFEGIAELRGKIEVVLSMLETMEANFERPETDLTLRELYADYAIIKYSIMIYRRLYKGLA